jgi:hypothetical protein
VPDKPLLVWAGLLYPVKSSQVKSSRPFAPATCQNSVRVQVGEVEMEKMLETDRLTRGNSGPVRLDRVRDVVYHSHSIILLHFSACLTSANSISSQPVPRDIKHGAKGHYSHFPGFPIPSFRTYLSYSSHSSYSPCPPYSPSFRREISPKELAVPPLSIGLR